MICPMGEGHIDIPPKLLKALTGKGKDEIHRDRLKGDAGQRVKDLFGLFQRSAQSMQACFLKRLDPDAFA